MKLKTISGKEVNVSILPEKYYIRNKEESKSLGQYKLGRLLCDIYGDGCIILEEFSIPEDRLFIDFFLPHHRIAFEYQGVQHDRFVKIFHGDINGFKSSKTRDLKKKEWCNINFIDFVEVREKDLSINEVRRLITESRNG